MKVGDGTPDAALAIGEDAFRAGWEARGRYQGREGVTKTVDQAWSEYDPPEDIKELS